VALPTDHHWEGRFAEIYKTTSKIGVGWPEKLEREKEIEKES
jgi:hypothetical protein